MLLRKEVKQASDVGLLTAILANRVTAEVLRCWEWDMRQFAKHFCRKPDGSISGSASSPTLDGPNASR